MRDTVTSSRRALRTAGVLSLIAIFVASPALAADDLADLALEDLMNLKVTSVSKREENRVDAAASITVLTQEDIRRSGATSVPEVLRLVPGLNVARDNASTWAISARGYNGQFANKMLVLVDGRTVYTPLFGGVYWDVQDMVLSDIDRIEVIRGPGGTLWGANAVNGVINITTKSAKDTQGAHVMGLAGNQEYLAEARYGGMVGESTGYRVWGRGFKYDDYTQPSGAPQPAHDEWYQWRVGARIDSDVTEKDLVTIQGEFYDGTEEAVAPLSGAPQADADVRGGNVVTRWTHAISDTQNTQLQIYYDYATRDWNVDETRQSVDVLFQHDFTLGKNDQWLFNWGAQYFYSRDDVTNGPFLAFNPDNANFNRASGFVQAQWNLLGGDLQITGGTKLEYNNWTDFEYQPTGRALWKFAEGNAIWGAISRAVREPTRVERDVAFTLVPVIGNKSVQSEDLTAYEFGYRNYMFDFLSVDLSLFFNQYKDLVALSQVAVPPDTFINVGESKAWGGEIEVTYLVTSDLRFITSYAYLGISSELSQGATYVFADPDNSNPQHTWMGRLLYNVPVLPIELDAATWYVSGIPGVPASGNGQPIGKYWRLDLRGAWQATDWLGLEFVAQNVTSDKHPEWNETLFPGSWVPRSYYGKVTLTF